MNEMSTLVIEKTVDRLRVQVYRNRKSLGESACEAVALLMKELLQSKPSIRMIFAAAPSQLDFLAALVDTEGIDWSRVTAFHMDEYIGLSNHATQRFSHFLKSNLYNHVQPGSVHLIDGLAPVLEECHRYTRLLEEAPIDIVCLGIGENGHLAFNDPPADFHDTVLVKQVELDLACRQQQVNDGCFTGLQEVPTHAITLTVPALMGAEHLICIVPGALKQQAVIRTLRGSISEDCPSTILRLHSSCTLYLDEESYGDQ